MKKQETQQNAVKGTWMVMLRATLVRGYGCGVLLGFEGYGGGFGDGRGRWMMVLLSTSLCCHSPSPPSFLDEYTLPRETSQRPTVLKSQRGKAVEISFWDETLHSELVDSCPMRFGKPGQ